MSPSKAKNDSEPILWLVVRVLLFQFLANKVLRRKGSIPVNFKTANTWPPTQPAIQDQAVNRGAGTRLWHERGVRNSGEVLVKRLYQPLRFRWACIFSPHLSSSLDYIEIRLYPTLYKTVVSQSVSSLGDSSLQVAFDSILREKSQYSLWVDPQTAPAARHYRSSTN